MYIWLGDEFGHVVFVIKRGSSRKLSWFSPSHVSPSLLLSFPTSVSADQLRRQTGRKRPKARRTGRARLASRHSTYMPVYMCHALYMDCWGNILPVFALFALRSFRIIARIRPFEKMSVMRHLDIDFTQSSTALVLLGLI